ncbi:MAG: 23S rRNA (guanosine(2251)-2'-O)-methyltransferase RlmB [Gammaproteobacteria bacterium]|nr:MAG: 23S rRNA (guanosine(2251)-2'-O)-methyltransferase RlmB [Gammaproteobacteria bacterium]
MNTIKPEFLYGLHAVAAVLRFRPQQVRELNVKSGQLSPAVTALVKLAEEHRIVVKQISAGQLQRLTNDGVHQGVVALTEPRRDLDDKDLEVLLFESSDNFFLVLDSIDDPRNLGACLRVADGAGVDGVIMARSRGARITPLVAKVSSGAAESVPCYRVANLARTLKFMGAAGVQIVGAAGGSAATIFDLSVSSNVALVIGHEGSGLRRLTRDHCDLLASIPMLGTVDSLNLSVAAGVMLYEIQQKRDKSSVE